MIEQTCETCGKEYKVYKSYSDRRKHHYCGVDCFRARAKKKLPTVKSLPGEVWRTVPGYPLFEVSSMERARKTTGSGTRIMAGGTRAGYRIFNVGGKQHCLHKLVALCFIGPPPGPHYVVRRGGSDRPQDLEYITRSEMSSLPRKKKRQAL